MKQALIWFYCQPIGQILWEIALLTGLFLLLRQKWGQGRGFRLLCLWGLGLWILGIVSVTILTREGATAAGYQLIPFHSYREVLGGGNPELLRSNFMNVLLFYPAGLLASACLPGHRCRLIACLATGLVFLAASAGIEYLQYANGLGIAEIDDVIHNTTGAVLGLALGCLKLDP